MRTRSGSRPSAIASAAGVAIATLGAGTAAAQDAARGAALYRALPGTATLGSCITCHGEPVNNRNSVLRGAAGAGLIGRTIGAVSAMGYLRQQLTEADLADIAAYLGTVVPPGAAEQWPDLWPTADDFGTQQLGVQSAPRPMQLRNLQPRAEMAIGAVLIGDLQQFPLQHDCPASLPPLASCRVQLSFRPLAEGPHTTELRIVDRSGRLMRSATLAGTGVAGAPARLAWADGTAELLDFERVTVGQSAQRTLRLENLSPQPVAIQRLQPGGPNAARFDVASACAQRGRIEAQASCEVLVRYTPVGAERAEGWIDLAATAGHPALVRLTGLGVATDVAPSAPNPSPPVTAAPAAGGTGGGATSPGWLVAQAAAALTLLALRRRR